MISQFEQEIWSVPRSKKSTFGWCFPYEEVWSVPRSSKSTYGWVVPHEESTAKSILQSDSPSKESLSPLLSSSKSSSCVNSSLSPKERIFLPPPSSMMPIITLQTETKPSGERYQKTFRELDAEYVGLTIDDQLHPHFAILYTPPRFQDQMRSIDERDRSRSSSIDTNEIDALLDSIDEKERERDSPPHLRKAVSLLFQQAISKLDDK